MSLTTVLGLVGFGVLLGLGLGISLGIRLAERER